MPAKHKDRGIRAGFHPPKGIPENIGGMKAKLCVFIPSDFLLSSPFHAIISSPPLPAAAAGAQPQRPLEALPRGTSLTLLGLREPQLQQSGALPKPSLSLGLSAAGDTSRVSPSVPATGALALFFPQISVFTFFPVIKIQKKSIVFLKGATGCTKCGLSLLPFSFLERD